MKKATTETSTTQTPLNKTVLAVIVLLFVITIGLVVLVSIYRAKNSPLTNSKNRTEYRNISVPTTATEDYVPMEESVATPIEVDNTTINELDSLMKDIDSTSTEDINDLSL